METTVMAVKAALVRARARCWRREGRTVGGAAQKADPTAAARADLDRYASLFNARDWDGVRALVADDCRLDLVSKSQRRGKEVRAYFARYEKQDVALGSCASRDSSRSRPTSPARQRRILRLALVGVGRVTAIRDFRYVPYIAAEAEFAE